MLEGFEDYTYELDKNEKELLPFFVEGLKVRVGKEKAITNKAMRAILNAKDIVIADSRVRKIINHIRRHDLVPGLIATSKGYYVSINKDEVIMYIKCLLSRENAVCTIRGMIQKYLGTL